MNEEKECYLITGSSGLLGDALANHFGAKGKQIIGFDQSSPPSPQANTDVLFCDLTSDESVQKTFFMVRNLYGSKIKAVFHLAAYYSFSGKESNLYQNLTVDGTRRMLRELEKFEVGQFIFSSSMLVYKPNEKGQKLTEQSEIAPTWEYPESKVVTEALIKRYHKKIPVVVLRIAGVYSDICQSIPIAHQIQRIYEHKLEGHLYSGDVDVKQSFVHIDDMISAFEKSVENADKLSDFEVFNIGEEDAMSYDDMQRSIARNLFDESWPTLEVPKAIAKAGAWVEEKLPLPDKPFIRPWMVDRADDNYELTIDKARQALGWEPQHSLRETLPKMLEGLKSDPEKWYKINHLHYNADHDQESEKKEHKTPSLPPPKGLESPPKGAENPAGAADAGGPTGAAQAQSSPSDAQSQVPLLPPPRDDSDQPNKVA